MGCFQHWRAEIRLEFPDYGTELPIPMPNTTRTSPNKKFKEWTDSLGNEVGMFHLNIEKRVFQDLTDEVIMPVQAYHLGMPEDALLKELMAQLGE